MASILLKPRGILSGATGVNGKCAAASGLGDLGAASVGAGGLAVRTSAGAGGLAGRIEIGERDLAAELLGLSVPSGCLEMCVKGGLCARGGAAGGCGGGGLRRLPRGGGAEALGGIGMGTVLALETGRGPGLGLPMGCW
jgi:hypothetical protein